MKYNVGDIVQIKSIDWYNENKDEYGDINCPPCMFVWVMCQYCGKILTINSVDDFDKKYKMTEDDGRFNWTDEMIEGLAEEETKPKYEDEVNGEYYSTLKYLVKPSGYQFVDENGNIINATKIVLEKKKKEYPKSYEECCKVLNIAVRDLDILDNMLDTTEIIYNKNLDRLLNSFRKLLICRDAYWKIAGEEMGLGKPWEPDWNDGELKWCMSYSGNYIEFDQYKCKHHTLAFPTEEMRDAFYEYFKELIEPV